MIEIKQEEAGYISLHGTFIHGSIHTSEIPDFISHLIEMGGVFQYAAIPNELPGDKVWEYVNQHYHLVPKKKKI